MRRSAHADNWLASSGWMRDSDRFSSALRTQTPWCVRIDGDAWGEDGLWEHGIHHPTVMDVPLVFRLQHAPVTLTSATTKVRVSPASSRTS